MGPAVHEDGEQLKKERRFRSIVENAQDAIIACDDGERIVVWNRAAQRIFGYGEQEILHEPFSMLLPVRVREGHAQDGFGGGSAAMFDARESGTAETVGLHKNGSELPLEVSFARADEHDELSVICFVRDITNRKQDERAMQQAKEAAEEASLLKSEFLANMSHEIRTPLNGILGMIELLADSRMDEEQREYITIVKKSSDTLLRVVNDILDFSKLQAKRLQLEETDFNPRSLLESVMACYRVRSQEKQLLLRCDFDDALPPRLRGDPGRLRQIVSSLVDNAVKFTEQGSVRLSCALAGAAAATQCGEAVPPATVRMLLKVADTGIGIPQEKAECIFESFRQADGSTTRRYGGTGLGLSITKELVELMGGTISLENKTGRGCTFIVMLPFASAPPSCATAIAGPVREARILIVDDKHRRRERVAGIVESGETMHASYADSGKDALQILSAAAGEDCPFQAVITQYNLSDMNGFMLAEKINSMCTACSPRCIVLMSAGLRGDMTRCQDAGVAAYLQSPVPQAVLVEALEKVLHESWRGETVTRHMLTGASETASVLLAEDDDVNQLVVKECLERLGWSVTVVGTGAAAVASLAEKDYDIVLMDIQMPDMNGIEAARKIRNRATPVRRHDVPILALTGHVLSDDRERFLEAGMDGVVTKPVDFDELISAIEQSRRAPAAADDRVV